MRKPEVIEENGRVYYPLTRDEKDLRMGELFSLNRKMGEEFNIITFAFLVDAPVDISALNRAYNSIVRLNDALRIRVVRRQFGLWQYIADFEEETLPVVDCTDRAGFQRYYNGLQLNDRMHLLGGKLVHGSIASFDEGCALVLRIHHDCIDGFSISLLLKQLRQCYTAFAAEEPEPKIKAASITEHLREEMEYVASDAYRDDLKYFRHQFMHQRDYRFPAGHSAMVGTTQSITRTISGETYAGLLAISRAEGVSMQLILLCIAALTTYKLTGKTNFSLAVLSHGRRTFRQKQMVGCLMKNLPLFFDIDPNQNLLTFIREYNVKYLNMLLHGRVTVSDLLLSSYKEAFRNGLNFNTSWFQFSAMDYQSALGDGKFSSDVHSLMGQVSQFYCAVFDNNSSETVLRLTYQDRKFKSDTIERIGGTFMELCAGIADDSNQTIASAVK